MMITLWYVVFLVFGPGLVGYSSLSLTAAALVGAIPLQLHLDTRSSWAAEMETWHSPGLVDELPHRTPVQPHDGERVDEPSTELVERLLTGLRQWDAGRHRLGEAPGTETQRAWWNTNTGQFFLIVADLGDLHEPCSHCAAPEDGERPHASCPGCACPCSVAPPLPEGVDGYAIAGRTR